MQSVKGTADLEHDEAADHIFGAGVHGLLTRTGVLAQPLESFIHIDAVAFSDDSLGLLDEHSAIEGTLVKGHEERPTGGHEECPLVARKTAHSWPTDLPTG
ncbi:hypothetical protein, partial [Cryobacterium melibiosiphilum]